MDKGLNAEFASKIGSKLDQIVASTHDKLVNGLLNLADVPGPRVAFEAGDNLRAELDIPSIPAVFLSSDLFPPG